MIKVLGNPENKRFIGDTAGLLKLRSEGHELRYEIMRGTDYAVEYAPRGKRDPMPWVQLGGLGSRLRATEIVAVEPTVSVEQSPRYITHSFMAGVSTRFAVKDTETGIDVADFSSRYAAREMRDRLESGSVVDRVDAAVRSSAGVSGPSAGTLPKRFPNR